MPASRTVNLLDISLAIWVAAWIALGVAIGVEVSHLSALSDTVVKEGRAVRTVGRSMRVLGGVPLIGGQVASTAAQVQAAGASAISSGASSASSITALSVLLGIAVAVLPSMPVLAFYVPARLERRRDGTAILRALRDPSGPDVRGMLAHRALHTLSYRRLRRLDVTDPALLSDDQVTALAEAELRRLDINPGLLRLAAGREL